LELTVESELIYLYFPLFFHQTVVVSVLYAFVVITTLSTCLVGVQVTSTPTRPVDDVVIITKGIQDRNNNCLMEGRWKIKVN
jgi:hypothetical protein